MSNGATPKLRIEIEPLITVFEGLEQDRRFGMIKSFVDELLKSGVGEVSFSSSLCKETFSYLEEKKVPTVACLDEESFDVSSELQQRADKITLVKSYDDCGFSFDDLQKTQDHIKESLEKCNPIKKTIEVCIKPQLDSLSLCKDFGVKSILADCNKVDAVQLTEFYENALKGGFQLSIKSDFSLSHLRDLIDKVSPKNSLSVDSFCVGSSLLPQVILRGVQRASREFVSEVSLP